MRLNLGCGGDVREGWVNVDRFSGPGVVRAELEDLPFPDGAADEVLASHVLEHVVDFAKAWREIHRVLRVGGVLEARVPYGFNTDPFHIRYFDERSVWWLTLPNGSRTLDRGTWWRVLDVYATRSGDGFPWWHVRHYLHVGLPFAPKRELVFLLQKVA